MRAVAACFASVSGASRYDRSWPRLRARYTSGLMANTAPLWQIRKERGLRAPLGQGSGDVWDGMVGERQARALAGRGGPAGRPRVPKPEPGEDALDHGRILDQRNHAHLRAAFRAGQRIDLVDLANRLRPRDLRGSTRLALGFRAGPVHIGTLVLRAPRSARHAAAVTRFTAASAPPPTPPTPPDASSSDKAASPTPTAAPETAPASH